MTPDTLRAELDELRQRLCFAFADRSWAQRIAEIERELSVRGEAL